MKITKRKIKDLIRAEYNPRKITPVEEFDLKESLMRFGLVEPIIININKERKDIVIGGHQRLKIWEQLGNDEIDCNQIDLTLDKERELNIRLNKNGGRFDEYLIKEYFEYEELTEWGFTPDELFEPDEKTIDGLIEDDEIPEVKESKVKRGDIWQLGDHRMILRNLLGGRRSMKWTWPRDQIVMKILIEWRDKVNTCSDTCSGTSGKATVRTYV